MVVKTKLIGNIWEMVKTNNEWYKKKRDYHGYIGTGGE